MPVAITVQAPGLVRVEAALGRVISGLRADADRRTRAFAERKTAEFKAAVPTGPQDPGSDRTPGTARGSVRLMTTGTSYQIVSDDPVIGYLLNGTAAHMIRVRNAQALAFILNGQMAFARSVFHPRTPPNAAMNAVRASASGEAGEVARQISAAVVSMLRG